MGNITIHKDNYVDATVVSNSFIDDYMRDANDAQLKIYLYLIRTMSANLATSISDIADKFNYTEKDVIRALKYWEKNKLLTIEYNDAKSIVGLHMSALDNTSPGEIVPLPVVKPLEPLPKTYEKPTYSADRLKEFKNNEETEQILFIAEQYLGKTLSVSEVKSVIFIYDVLGFSADLIDFLIEYCVGKGKKSFHYIEKVAMNWAEENITTVKQAKTKSSKYDKTVYSVMKALGKGNNTPTEKEVSFIQKWIKEYSYTIDVIHLACEKTVMATDKHRFEYTEGILNRWYSAGIRHKDQIPSFEQEFQRSRLNAAKPNKNQFNNFEQRTYDYSTLEEELISN